MTDRTFSQSSLSLGPYRLTAKALPWRDRKGAFSLLKAVSLALLVAPALWIGAQLALGWLQPKPITQAIHLTGDWGIRFLVASLAITPLRRILDWPRLLDIRRMVGVASFAYLLAHFLLYILDQRGHLGVVAWEIAARFYLTIGFAAFVGLGALAATSTDAFIRQMGPERWARLHRSVYVLTLIGLLHYFIQSKLDISAALPMFGLFVMAMGHRQLQKRKIATTPLMLLGLGIGAAIVTGLGEAAWYYGRNGTNPLVVLANNFNFLDGFGWASDFEWADLRPEWIMVGAGLALAVLNAWRGRR